MDLYNNNVLECLASFWQSKFCDILHVGINQRQRYFLYTLYAVYGENRKKYVTQNTAKMQYTKSITNF